MNIELRLPRLTMAAFLYGVLLASVFAFGVYGRQGLIDPVVDLNGFGAIARNIANGDGFTQGDYGPTVRRAPLFPYLAGGILALFGDAAADLPETVLYRPIIVANCVIFGFTCAVVHVLTRRLFGGRAACLAVLMCPFVPQTLRYVGMTEVETTMGLMTVLLAWTGTLVVGEPTVSRGAAFGVAAAAATLTKPVTMLYPPFLLIAAAFYWRQAGILRTLQVRVAATALLCFGLLLAPWSIRNAVVTDGAFKGISSNAPGEFLRGYINAQPKYYLLKQNFGGGDPTVETWDPEANDYERELMARHGAIYYQLRRDQSGREVMVPTPPPGATNASLELERDRVEGSEMKRKLLQEPLDFLRKFVIQLFTFWYIVETRTKSLLVGGIALVMLSLAALGYVRGRRRKALMWPSVLVIAYMNVLYAAILAFARYSMPVYPTLVVLSSGGLLSLLERLRQRVSSAASRGEARRPAG